MKTGKIIFRIFNDTLAVVINVQTERVVLLQDRWLRLWKEAVNGRPAERSAENDDAIRIMMRLGIIPNPDGGPSGLRADEPETGFAPETVDFGLINLWSFENRIPISGHFELTARCNLRCRHCYCVFDKTRDTLSAKEIIGICEDLKKNGTIGLVLTGGEIFCRQDIMDILFYLDEAGFIVRVNTNGTLIDDKAMQTISRLSNVYRFHVSLYGADAATHDRITQVEGSFHKTMRALRLVRDAGFKTRINCSVMRSNYDSYKKIQREIGDSLGIPVHYDSIIFPKDDGTDDNLTEQLDDQHNKAYLQYKAENEITKPKENKPKLCKAGFSFFSICEDGRLYPCLKMKRYFAEPLGNLAVEPFESIWRSSPLALKIRNTVEKKLRKCHICDLSF